MKVSVPAERIESEVESRLRNLARTARLKGFRPGKVPLKVMESRYGPQVRQEVIGEVTQSSFYEAVSQEKLQLAGMPRFQQQVAEPGKDLEYEAVFEVLEEIALAPLDNVEISKPVAEITDGDVDNMLETLRRQRTQWEPVERAAQNEDQLVIDFHGTVEGEEFAGNSGEQVPVVLGAHSFIAGFEEGLIGASAGDERTLELRFPEDYHVQSLAGKPVRFDITVRTVSEPRLPELDEEFARSFEIAGGTVESLRQEVRKTMQDELDEAVRDRVRQEVMETLYSQNPIDVPQSQIEEQTQLLMSQTREALKGQGMAGDDMDLDRSLFEERARRRVALGILLNEIVKQQKFSAEPERVRERVESIAAGYENPDEAIKWYYADRSRLANIEQLVLEEHVVDWVLEQARVKEEPTSFDELMKDRRGGGS